MASLFTFKNADKIYNFLKSDKSSKRPRQLCKEAGSTIARIDDDAFVYVKTMLEKYNIRRIIFSENAGKNDCFLSFKGESLLEHIETVCNEDIRNQLVICQKSIEGHTIRHTTNNDNCKQ